MVQWFFKPTLLKRVCVCVFFFILWWDAKWICVQCTNNAHTCNNIYIYGRMYMMMYKERGWKARCYHQHHHHHCIYVQHNTPLIVCRLSVTSLASLWRVSTWNIYSVWPQREPSVLLSFSANLNIPGHWLFSRSFFLTSSFFFFFFFHSPSLRIHRAFYQWSFFTKKKLLNIATYTIKDKKKKWNKKNFFYNHHPSEMKIMERNY